MLQTILRTGLISGLIVGTALFFGTWAMKDMDPSAMSFGAIFGYAAMLAALSLIFVAVKRQRDIVNGGVIKFLPAFLMGLGITAVAGVIYVLAWELTLAVLDLDFAGKYATAMIEAAREKGMEGAELDAYAAEVNQMMASYANPLFRMPLTFTEILPVGVLVSLVSALLLRNSKFLPYRPVV